MDLKHPTRVPEEPLQQPPAMYLGETSRSCFVRGLKHLQDYRAKLSKCSLWRHTRDHHDGQLGPDRGSRDFKMTKLRRWPKPLDRLSAEGSLIHDGENQQNEKKIICMNSKEDFSQSHKTTIQFNTGSSI